MPQTPYPVTGRVFASDSSTGYEGVSVLLRNTTKESKMEDLTESDGSFAFDLSQFIGGYMHGDSLKLDARMGSFQKTADLTVDTGVLGLDQDLTLAAESLVGIIDLYRLKEEIVIFLRQRLTDPESRGSVKTSTQSGTGSKVKFNVPDTNIKYIDSVLVNNAPQNNYTQYYVEYNDKKELSSPVVYFLTPPANGAMVEFKYNYGQTSWVYPDVPRSDLALGSYPRVSVSFVSVRTAEGGLGALSNITDILGSITVWSTKESELNDIINDIRTIIMENKKDFYYFKLMVPQATGPVLVSTGREERILQQTQDFLIQFRLEVI